MENQLKKKLIAVIPKYLPDLGNCTLIYTEENDPLTLKNTITTVMNRIARYHMVDLNAMKERNGKLINASYPVPISLNNDIFIPIKVRKPIGKNDKSIGYLNLEYIDTIKQGNDTTMITLSNELKIECLYRKETLNRHIHNGRIIKDHYNKFTESYQPKHEMLLAREGSPIYDNGKTIINLYLSKDILT